MTIFTTLSYDSTMQPPHSNASCRRVVALLHTICTWIILVSFLLSRSHELNYFFFSSSPVALSLSSVVVVVVFVVADLSVTGIVPDPLPIGVD